MANLLAANRIAERKRRDKQVRRAQIISASPSVDARLDVWEGMPHAFAGSVGQLATAANALDAAGEFLAQRLKATAGV